MKEELKTLLTGLGHQVHDFGTIGNPVDYPDLAYAVARSVAEGTSDLGIVIDGAGVGSAMTANKVPGVRAAACYSVEVARNSREHNGAMFSVWEAKRSAARRCAPLCKPGWQT